jgi:phage baseplate assembly protein W
MTWSIGLTEDGDLALGSKGLAKVANEQKLMQDIKCELLEKRGSNRFNENYGSSLENKIIGTTPNSLNDLHLQIETEIAAVVNRYKARQLSRAKVDKMSFGKATLTAREVVMDFQITKLEQNLTAANVEINFITAKANPEAYPIKLSVSL